MPKCPGGHRLLGDGNHDLERATSAQGARGHIDGVSMVEVVLMAQLLWAIPDQASVLMVSDVDPAVGWSTGVRSLRSGVSGLQSFDCGAGA